VRKGLLIWERDRFIGGGLPGGFREKDKGYRERT
jgi:hypothetical protein